MIARLKHAARRAWRTLRGLPYEWTVVGHSEELIEGRLWRRAQFANGQWSAYRLVDPESAPSHSP